VFVSWFKTGIMGMVFVLMMGSSCLVFASSSDEATISNEITEAVEESQTSNSVATYDEAYTNTISNAISNAETDIYEEKDELINEVENEISNSTDSNEIASLNAVLEQLQNDYNVDTFVNATSDIPTTTLSTDADNEALENEMSTLSDDLTNVETTINNAYEEEEELEANYTTYATNNSSSLLSAGESSLPSVSDGTQAIIYKISGDSSEYYYVDAGIWSGVSVGDVYGILNTDGDGEGNMKIVCRTYKYSIGILVHSDGIETGYSVKGLTTCQTNPNSD